MSAPGTDYLTVVKAAILNIKTLDPANVTDGALLKAQLEFGSIDLVDLFFEIEKATGITVDLPEIYAHLLAGSPRPDRDFTVGELVGFFASRRNT